MRMRAHQVAGPHLLSPRLLAHPCPRAPRALQHHQWLQRERCRRGGTPHRLDVEAAAAAAAAAAATAAAAAPGGSVPLISAGWGVWGCLAICAAIAQVADHRTRIGSALSAPLVAMLCGMVLAAVGVLPIDCVTYDAMWEYLMPLAAACLMLEADLSELLNQGGGAVLVGFLLGGCGMALGATVAYALLHGHLGAEGGKLAACLCASYIGGTSNFCSVAKVVGLPAASMPAAMAIDNLAMAMAMALLCLHPIAHSKASTTPAARQSALAAAAAAAPAAPAALASAAPAATAPLHPQGAAASAAAGAPASGAHAAQAQADSAGPTPALVATGVSTESLALALCAAAGSCWLGTAWAEALGMPAMGLMFMSIVALGLSTAGNRLLPRGGGSATAGPFAGASQLGGAILNAFFAVVGCSAGSVAAFVRPETPALLCFIMIMVGVHWMVMAAANVLFPSLPTSSLLLASNACIGGPATAAGMAASKDGWAHMVQPAMLAGSSGYAVGTAAGLVVARVIGAW